MHEAAGLSVVELKDGVLLIGVLSYEDGQLKVSSGFAGRPTLVDLVSVHDITPAEHHPDVRIVRTAPETRQRQGIYVSKWTTLSIPAGRLVIRLGPGGSPQMDPVMPHLTVNMWPHWLDLGFGHLRSANRAHNRLADADAEGSNDDIAEALSDELQASTQAIACAAFSVDALYGAVRDRASVSATTRAAWSRNKTKRASQILETFRAAASIPGTALPALRTGVRAMFELRDQAVHPTHGGRDPVLHPVLGVGVEQRYVEYTAKNALGALSIAIECVYWLGENSTLTPPADTQWAAQLPSILAGVAEQHHVTFRRR